MKPRPDLPMAERKAVYPGSFDPFTNGHLDIVERALDVVDHLTIAILRNTSKKNLFTPERRVELIQQVIGDNPRITVDTFQGLLVDYCKANEITIILRGLRAVSDFDYEHAIYLMNNKLKPDLETVFLMSRSENSFISSSIVKEVASLGGDIRDQVPQVIFDSLQEVFNVKS